MAALPFVLAFSQEPWRYDHRAKPDVSVILHRLLRYNKLFYLPSSYFSIIFNFAWNYSFFDEGGSLWVAFSE